MTNPDRFDSADEAVEVDKKTVAAIGEGVLAADEGRIVPAEAVPKLISRWISKFSTQNQR
jgi:predicted transcriptional regulator